MIGKVCKRGADVRRLLGYLFREGLAGEHGLTAPHTAPRLIAAWDGVAGLEPPRTAGEGRDLRRVLPSESRQLLKLVTQLEALALAVARLREAQDRAAQAAAAREAAERLATAAAGGRPAPRPARSIDLAANVVIPVRQAGAGRRRCGLRTTRQWSRRVATASK